jgi:hypothetical protein
MNAIMTRRAEREDLQRLVRQREKVLRSAAKQRSAELLADFENQMGSEYSFDQDEVWRQAAEAAEREVSKAKRQVAARCRELGIPDRFAPSLELNWRHRGWTMQSKNGAIAPHGANPNCRKRTAGDRSNRNILPRRPDRPHFRGGARVR